MNRLKSLQNEGGFLRFNISLYDEKISKRTKKNKWFIYNNTQTEMAIKYFLEKVFSTL